MIEAISPFANVQRKHRDAPLLEEREQYLGHLLRQGVDRMVVRSTAGYLVHITRILELKELRSIETGEIDKAGAFWANYTGPYRQKFHEKGASQTFVRIAKAWLLFHGRLALPQSPAFHELIAEFSEAMRCQRGLAPESIRGYSSRTFGFLKWFAERSDDFSSVSIFDVDAFLEARRAEGWGPRSMATQCQAMRSFFRYAETQGWCRAGIPLGIRSPRIPKYEVRAKGPTWVQVRRMLQMSNGLEPLQLRSKAMMLLFAIYGLRSSEVSGLRLDDFDWRNEIFAVRKAKRGGIQHYPIQYEVGEAILAYLQNGRPKSSSRFLFVSTRRPYGPISRSPMWKVTSVPIRNLGIELDHIGPHALRHACATRLLQKGASLKEIADFLGHRNERSIGIYARYDTRSLRKVAAFRLAGL